jgi:hypothetical protein
MELSARNQLAGTVKSVPLGAIMAEVVVDVRGQEDIAAITRSSGDGGDQGDRGDAGEVRHVAGPAAATLSPGPAPAPDERRAGRRRAAAGGAGTAARG